MTKLEMAAIALANEIESNIRIGVPLTTNLVSALDQFRKTQIESDKLLGADLDSMYKQYEITLCPVIAAVPSKKST